MDLGADGITSVIERGKHHKKNRKSSTESKPLAGKTVAILLEKASTRTRLSFEVGVYEMGGMPSVILAKDTQLGRGEPISDTAKMFSGYLDAVVYRTHGHERITELCDHSSIPVINGLSDMYHPCQLLADLMTMDEVFGAHKWRDLKVSYLGDCGNNMAHSWMLASMILGFELALVGPKDFPPHADVLKLTAGQKQITITDKLDAVKASHVLTTDVWISMGQEEEANVRRNIFKPYQVNDALMKHAGGGAIFLHCLPAHREEEVTESVLTGPNSKIWQEAENRLHAQKGLLNLMFA